MRYATTKLNAGPKASTSSSSPDRTGRKTHLLGARLAGTISSCIMSMLLGSPAWADFSEATPKELAPITAEAGRIIFNGKGLCSTCHGIDGSRNRPPEQLTPNARKSIAGLDPQPADLRNPAALKLTTDKQRFEAIRHGRLRSAMHPLSKEVLSDDDILSLLAYLASIRGTSLPSPQESVDSPSGEIETGRRLYHEIGNCYVCHGREGYLKRRSNLPADLQEKLSKLQPPPADLRNPAALKSENDRDRFRSIKYGHPGTAMFPKPLLSDEDIWDLIAYLGTLRENRR